MKKLKQSNEAGQAVRNDCLFFFLSWWYDKGEGRCVMLLGEFLSLFWKYLQFNTEGDIKGIFEDAPDEAKKAFRHFMKLMQDPHRNV